MNYVFIKSIKIYFKPFNYSKFNFIIILESMCQLLNKTVIIFKLDYINWIEKYFYDRDVWYMYQWIYYH